MKKIYSFLMATALLVAGVAMTGCNKDNNSPQHKKARRKDTRRTVERKVMAKDTKKDTVKDTKRDTVKKDTMRKDTVRNTTKKDMKKGMKRDTKKDMKEKNILRDRRMNPYRPKRGRNHPDHFQPVEPRGGGKVSRLLRQAHARHYRERE